MEGEDINRRNQEKFGSAALFWIGLANQQLFELNKQLIGLAIVVLPLTASIIAVDLTLREFQKTLILISWVFLFISIISGFIQLFVDVLYFKYLSNDSSKRQEIWRRTDIKTEEKERATDALGKVKESSTHVPLYLQAFSIVFALILIMIVASSFLISK